MRKFKIFLSAIGIFAAFGFIQLALGVPFAFWKTESNPGSWTPMSVVTVPAARYAHSAIWTGSEMVVWGGLDATYFNSGGKYNSTTDSWTPTSTTNAPVARQDHKAVWNGTEMIVWGGYNGIALNTGGKYNPSSDTWVASNLSFVDERTDHSAVWSGTEMIVWGGYNGTLLNTGKKYNPVTDVWTAVTTTGAPTARRNHKAVWATTTSEMIVWGGDDGTSYVSTGAKYKPSTDSWITTLDSINTPLGRVNHTAVWSGTEMLVWGGLGNGTSNYLNTGGKYNPTTNTWGTIDVLSLVPERSNHRAVWTGAVMIVFGGYNGSSYLSQGAKYDPSTNAWTALQTTNAPSARADHSQVYSTTTSEVFIWGGYNGSYLNDGAIYDVAGDSWTAMTGVNAPTARRLETTIWSGADMIVWGGETAAATYTNTGGKFNAAAKTWTALSVGANVPSARYHHVAVWASSTSEMIVWGGEDASSVLGTGGRYKPSTDSWLSTDTSNAPAARLQPSAVFTGTEMIIFAGNNGNGSGNLNTGGRYNPTTDTWSNNNLALYGERKDCASVWSTTTDRMLIWGGNNGSVLSSGKIYDPATDTFTMMSSVGAPEARDEPAFVWTGTYMVVWGGQGATSFLNTGGRYNAATDTWSATSVGANVPTARIHTAFVWTGTYMIIWGGWDGTNYKSTGARYNVGTDTWSTMAIAGNPSARADPTAVWTGSHVLIWGGYNNPTYLATGGKYDPALDSWVASNIDNSGLIGRRYHSAVWTGTYMIVWGGFNGGARGDGARYNAGTDTWSSVSSVGAPAARYYHTGIWASGLATPVMLIWSGFSGSTTGYKYNPATDTWGTMTSTNAPNNRYRHCSVWASSLATPILIVWGGVSGGPTNTGGRYNPATDVWDPSDIRRVGLNTPAIRFNAEAVWDGTYMIMWGGSLGSTSTTNTGGRYNPTTDAWVVIPVNGSTPASRKNFSMVMTTTYVVIYGGEQDGKFFNDGARYNPTTNAWNGTAMAAGGTNAPPAREYHSAVWSGSDMIVWGGYSGSALSSGAKYNSAGNTWTTTSVGANLPSARYNHTAVWNSAASEMIVWGGWDGTTSVNTGATYNVAGNSWTTTSVGANVPTARFNHTAIWNGTSMIVWGGWNGTNYYNDGGVFTPGGAGTWTAMSSTNAPLARYGHTAVWNSTAGEMLVWGGYGGGYTNTGGKYNLAGNTWVRTGTGANVPQERRNHTAVWNSTAGDMIVWGGTDGTSYFNTGAKYNSAADTWTQTSTGAGVPTARAYHTAVWTGTKMIIWGGWDGSYYNTGAQYNSAGDSWTATSVGANVPSARRDATAVWTNSKMIIWGGYDGTYPTTGSQYDPTGNSWVATTTANAPTGRKWHTAVWSGTDMIIWGGYDGAADVNTGAKYNPTINYWATTSMDTNVPTAREKHTAVWNGTVMLIWGGINGTTVSSGGVYTP